MTRKDPGTGRSAVFAFALSRLSALSALLREGADRMASRKWLIALGGAGLFLAAAFAGLAWQAALAGVGLFALAAAVLPLTGRAARENISQDVRAGKAQVYAPVNDILQALPDPAILLDEDGVVAACNRKARDQWDNLRRGSHLASAIRQPALLDAVSAVAGGARPVTVTYTERVPVERRIAATVAAIPSSHAGDAGGPAILVSLHDLSEQERLNQMRADFVANASHELRTPLSSLLGFIETLQGPAQDDAEARGRFLDIMAKQARRMTRLIDDLLSLSRVEMNVHLHPTGVVDLNELVAHVTDTLDPVARESGITIATSLPPRKVRVQGERDELVQLMQNLIQNAIKYGREGGRIRVSVKRTPGADGRRARVALSVADDGPGIAPEHLPRLTERFYRVDVASSREKGGTGLGLAIVKHIVTRHRGELRIDSEPGKGSTFTVHLDEAAKSAGESVTEDSRADALETT